ncbi:MAG: hypothetical protein WA962_11250 [Ornithinimicrobium sp.]
MSLLRKALKRANRVVLITTGAVLVLVVFVCAVLSWWEAAITALALLQLILLAVGLGLVPPQGGASTSTLPSGAEVTDLERRVELLSTRVVASTERARVEILDALVDRHQESNNAS